MNEIFLSYKREDRALARKLADALNEAFKTKGWSVWWDNYIPPGSSWDEVIEQRLRAARCVVVLWSRNSINAQYVKNEARKANQRRVLVPVSLESLDQFEIPTEFSHLQAANLVNWKPGSPDPEFENLLASIAEKLAVSASPNSSTPRTDRIPGKTQNKKPELPKSPVNESGFRRQQFGGFTKLISNGKEWLKCYWQVITPAVAILLIVTVSLVPQRESTLQPKKIEIIALDDCKNNSKIKASFTYHETGHPDQTTTCQTTQCNILAHVGTTINWSAKSAGHLDNGGEFIVNADTNDFTFKLLCKEDFKYDINY